MFTVSELRPSQSRHSPTALHRPASETLRRTAYRLLGPQPDLAGLAADPAFVHSLHAAARHRPQPISSQTLDRRSLPLVSIVSPPHCLRFVSTTLDTAWSRMYIAGAVAWRGRDHGLSTSVCDTELLTACVCVEQVRKIALPSAAVCRTAVLGLAGLVRPP